MVRQKLSVEATTLRNRFSFNTVYVIGSRLCLVRIRGTNSVLVDLGINSAFRFLSNITS